jgi:hypothetical protein
MGIISAIGGFSAAKKQKKAAKRAARAEQARVKAEQEKQRIEQVRANVATRKERLKSLREARIRRAQIIQAGINAGAEGSSTVEGAIGGIGTQFGAAQGQINVAQGFGEAISQQNEASAAASGEISRQQGKIAVSQAKQQVFKAAGDLAQGIFERGGGFTSMFGGGSFGGR